jgi:ParB-like chromosome segregation protein Spo0J
MIESRIRLLDLSSITLPASRQRSKISYEKVLEYAISIAQHGVIQEPGVREEGLVLTWGGHRYNSFCLLRALETGESTELTTHYKPEQLDELRALLPLAPKHYERWSKIPVKLIRDASPLLLGVLELAENLNREDLPWQDKAAAVEAVHKQAVADAKLRNESWTDADTARLLGLDRRTATLYLTPQRKLEAIIDPEVKAKAAAAIKQSPSARSAINSAETIASRHGIDTSPHAQVKQLLKGKETGKQTAPVATSASPILCADFHEWAATYDGPLFNFFHCDFPYGVEFNRAEGQSTSAATRAVGEYDDGEEVYWKLLNTLLQSRDKLLEDSSHIMFWLSVGMSKQVGGTMYDLTKEAIYTAWPDAYISSTPLIWHCSDNSGLMPDPKRAPRRTYEWALHITLGDRPLAKPVAASFAYPRNSDDKLHRSQKHEAVLRHFFQLFVDSSTRMLDPTAGSGTSVLTAHKMGAASVLGLELDPDMAAMAQRAFEETR